MRGWSRGWIVLVVGVVHRIQPDAAVEWVAARAVHILQGPECLIRHMLFVMCHMVCR